LENMAFSVSVNLMIDDSREKIDLVTGFSSSKSCVGTYTYMACTLEAAVGEYDVIITGNSTELKSATPRILAIANNTQVNTTWDREAGGFDSTLAGLVTMHWSRWQGYVTYFKLDGALSTFAYNLETYSQFALPDNTTCPSFSDPMAAMLASWNRLMVYTGMIAAEIERTEEVEARMDPGMRVHDAVMGQQLEDVNVYKTNFDWFIAAVVVELVCIGIIAPLYWGWWNLGRPVGFSPLEMALVCPARRRRDFGFSQTDILSGIQSARPRRLRFERFSS
jgi:hypothetical protein